MQVSESSHQILELVVRSILSVGVHMKNIHLGKATVKKTVYIMFLGLLDPDPLVRDTDPTLDPSIMKQK
jgi:hypothetical protein